MWKKLKLDIVNLTKKTPKLIPNEDSKSQTYLQQLDTKQFRKFVYSTQEKNYIILKTNKLQNCI